MSRVKVWGRTLSPARKVSGRNACGRIAKVPQCRPQCRDRPRSCALSVVALRGRSHTSHATGPGRRPTAHARSSHGRRSLSAHVAPTRLRPRSPPPRRSRTTRGGPPLIMRRKRARPTWWRSCRSVAPPRTLGPAVQVPGPPVRRGKAGEVVLPDRFHSPAVHLGRPCLHRVSPPAGARLLRERAAAVAATCPIGVSRGSSAISPPALRRRPAFCLYCAVSVAHPAGN